jgi:hypothetical protein
VQWLAISEDESQALESLTHFQMCVLFGHTQQVKVLDCLESRMEDFESDRVSERDENIDSDIESEGKGEEFNDSYDESDDECNLTLNFKFQEKVKSPNSEIDANISKQHVFIIIVLVIIKNSICRVTGHTSFGQRLHGQMCPGMVPRTSRK